MKKKAEVNSFDRSVILMTMEDFCGRQKLVSSVKKLLAITPKNGVLDKKASLIRALSDMNSTWKLYEHVENLDSID
jgi:hypothetical protein